jgi:branched-chain amino acid transport system ATP-binding protein
MLEVKNLELALGNTSILKGASFKVNQAETVGIIGPNGSGKTTLFNCISGFHFPDSGQVLLNEKDITNFAPHIRAKLGLGRVFQNPGIFKEMTVLENLITALESSQSFAQIICPWSALHKHNREYAMSLLEDIKLSAKAKDKASSLSGGQMRLLEIVRTLAYNANVLLLDEPTAGVSPKMKDEVIFLIKKLQAANKTILVIEHDINFIQQFCDRIIVLDGGKVVLEDTPTGVRSNERLREIYFGAEA